MMKYRTVNVPPGIGDSVWILQKLLNAPDEKFNFLLPGGLPRRGKQIFDLLPDIVETCNYDPDLKFSRIEEYNIANTKNAWSLITEHEFNLSANKWLEAGNRIEDFLHDLPTTYIIPWKTSDSDINTAHAMTLSALKNGQIPIGIYASAYSTSRAWGFWDFKKWTEFVQKLHILNPRFHFFVIGAEWDVDTADKLMACMKGLGIPYTSTIGHALGFVIELMKRLQFGFYFPSGLGIISGLLEAPSVMWYPKHLKLMQGTYKNPENDSFHEMQMNTPDAMINYLHENTTLLK